MPKSEPEQPFDKEQVYDEQIAPLVAQIIEICQTNQMPLVLSICYAWNEEEGAFCCSTSLPGNEWTPSGYQKAIDAILNRPDLSPLLVTVTRQEE